SHVDAQIDAAALSNFISAYQTVVPLKLGELWAIPIMLRLGLIENLQRVTSRLTVDREDRDQADLWVGRLQEMAENHPSRLVVIVAEMAKADINLSSSFVAEFAQRLSRQTQVLNLARSWLEQRLGEQGTTIEQLIQIESQSQAADQVSVSHSIGSLRFLSATDWKGFVESLSVVEKALRSGSDDVYGKMNFATRDRYRHVVEFMARHGGREEEDVARRAVEMAEEGARQNGAGHRTGHVGYYLVGKGHDALAREARVEWPWHKLVERGVERFPMTFYGGGIGLLTGLMMFGFVREAEALGVEGWKLVFFSAVFFLCASQLAVVIVNWLATLLMQPKLLPRLDYMEGIAPESRTMVVVPTMLTNAEGVDRLIETLEIHHLGNPDENLYFGLLTDFRDASEEVQPGDAALLERVKAGVEMLNQRYAAKKSPFFLFHRPRRWNAGEGLWMGYERKRGKLTELNVLLRGGSREAFSVIVGNTDILPTIKYVVTLDTDTLLPRDAARELAGTMAHPLNRAVFDEEHGTVTEGYSILQPRVGISLPSARRSWFVRLFAGEAGIDPYTRAVSDVYQDVFQEGSFIGKGIYDVDAFQRAMEGRFPENTILSHDLLESCHARSALVSDVEFYEEYPWRYNVDISRRHRWIRGDWQITPWLLPRVPGTDARRIANPLSMLSQWKILDNLRRSLVPVALMIFILGAWLALPEFGGRAMLLVLLIVALPSLLSAATSLFGKPDDSSWRMHWRSVGETFARQIGQIVLTLAFLPYDAFVSLDAVGRTLLRILVTHKRLLEWTTSSDSERTSRSDLRSFYWTMWIEPVIAVGVGIFLLVTGSAPFGSAWPMLIWWLVAPWIAWRISQPIEILPLDLREEQIDFLRRTARKMWHFFETFVTEQENWLPPDNFQEIPKATIAPRTSPTNMGLALLANLAARDFGYLTAQRLISRTRDALGTMQRLERYRGHFYNWYDTRTTRPLIPLYISSVDSGNLSGHLLTLGSGLRELCDQPIFTPQIFEGLRDTLRVLRSLTRDTIPMARLDAELRKAPAELRAAYALLQRAGADAAGITAMAANQSEEIKTWAEVFKRQCEEQLEELLFLAPWVALPAEAGEKVAQTESTPTLREAGEQAHERVAALEALAAQCDELAVMDFTFLYDSQRDLFSIGFNVAEGRRDGSYYDLLASEARLGSYVAVALGQVPQEHWFSMGRLLIASRGEPILVSWSGSMFEYLMPMLVMPSYENTLLDLTCKSAVRQQIDYGRMRGVPWGISESGYNRTDVQLNYQYR
ncbi:MAG TPA: glycosyltransferase family 2 protein, partial [Verrucomicrobiae bacterium]